MYSAYQLDSSSRDALLKQITPKYPRILADHITVQYGGNPTLPEKPTSVQAIGIADDNHGLQTLIISVNSHTKRPDGSFYHLTFSLNPHLICPLNNTAYQPVHSNLLLHSLMSSDGTLHSVSQTKGTIHLFDTPIPLSVHPVLKFTTLELSKKKDQTRKNLEF